MNMGGPHLSVQLVDGTLGNVKKATGENELSARFIGIIQNNVTSGSEAVIITSGIVNGFTGLQNPNVYYLSNTPGAISTTPGSFTKMIGIAISSQELLMGNGF